MHGRAALASCLAIGYSVELARAGFAPRSVEVEVQTDYDLRGIVGMDGVAPDYVAVRHTLYLDCDGPRETRRRSSNSRSAGALYLQVFANPQPVTGQVVFGSRPQV